MNKLVITKGTKDNIDSNSVLVDILLDKNKSDIKNNIVKILRKYGKSSLEYIYEDLLIISMGVYFADKNFSRQDSEDNWSRDIVIKIPVINLGKWETVKNDLERLLGFLSGDKWKIEFYLAEKNVFKVIRSRIASSEIKVDAVSLFSGGLDSFCGAIKLLENKKKICFVSYKEYKQIDSVQEKLFDILNECYPEVEKDINQIYNSVRKKCFVNSTEKYKNENTTRSRSFLFLCYGIAIAGINDFNTPVYIPENGFIGINVPMTESRVGSCSTRTTHPYFIDNLNNILTKVGIQNKIENISKHETKTEIVDEVSKTKAFLKGYKQTMSCSHPCSLSMRRDGIATPCNCGYCYPCLIRRSSLIHVDTEDDGYAYKLNLKIIDNTKEKSNDIIALLNSIYEYKEDNSINKIKSKIIKVAPLKNDDIEKYSEVYSKTMGDLLIFFECKDEYKEIINSAGIK